MKIELNESASAAIIAVCLLAAFWQVASCATSDNAGQREVEKAHIAAGDCNDGWGKWTKCKPGGPTP